MAGADDGRISNKQYTQLADAISGPNMVTIAQGYLDIDPEHIESIRAENLNKVHQSNVAILKRWANRTENSRPDQRKRLAQILYEAGDEAGYINPNTIEKILGFTMQQTNAEVPSTATSVPDVVPESPELTLKMLLKLSKMYNTEDKICSLALFGLEMDEKLVEKHLTNNKEEIHSAAFKILKDWRDFQQDLKIAYQKLCAVLKHQEVNTPELINLALQ